MKTWMAVLTMVVSLGFAATAQAADVTYDYDRAVDFDKWSTFAPRAGGAADESIAEGRIRRAVEKGFAERGYVQVVLRENADFLVTWRAAAWNDVQVSGGYYRPAFGRIARIDRVPTGRLVVEVIDRRTGKVAWHGSVTDELARDGEEAEVKTAKTVAKLLKKFPLRVAP